MNAGLGTAPVLDLPPSTALLVVDMQNGFCHPDGTVACGGTTSGCTAAS
jgi:nicotinamidase-related amidase